MPIDKASNRIVAGILLSCCLFGCSTIQFSQQHEKEIVHSDNTENFTPINSNATQETKNLYKNLMCLSDNHMLWGVQAEDAYRFTYELSGKYAGLYGVPFSPKGMEIYRSQIIDHYNNNGVVTVSWHNDNYLTGGQSWVDNDKKWKKGMNVVQAILPGGAKNKEYLSELDNLANFLSSLNGSDGKKIPIIFRPYHEMNGKWFWWGESRCTNEEYIALFRYTIDYLIKEKSVNNILVAWSPSGGAAFKQADTDIDTIKSNYMNYYPGDEYVDIIGFDCYINGSKDAFIESKDILANASATVALAEEHNKIPAMTEGGNGSQGSMDGWWVDKYLNSFKNDPALRKLRYAQTWRADVGKEKVHAPYPGAKSAESFKVMANDPFIIMQGEYKWYK